MDLRRWERPVIALGASLVSSTAYFSLTGRHRYGADLGSERSLYYDCYLRGIIALDVKDRGFPIEHSYTHQGRHRTRRRRGRRDQIYQSLTGVYTKLSVSEVSALIATTF
ncbi:hypothetical protein ARMSODRAFT_224885 [Armillaria solidipes]|uniref:Uncharacterized protein n=1 Tax=Armillaria solidipes TaxID=1076256 RepID=A0A2H3C521_9AGAR|nr:hypothetical protein ARMSODRAFT_224885 [Armillaria solidipes]